MTHVHSLPVAAALVLLVALANAVSGMIVIDGTIDHTILPHPLPRPQRPVRIAPLETLEHNVTVTIRDQVATTTVDQVFHNPGRSPVEGTFLFPLPRGAHIEKFTMEIDGKPVEAELLDAEKARKIYEDIVRRMRDPALLEYAGAELVTYRIFPIQPNEKKRITLRYTQLLRADNQLVTYTYPLNTRKHNAKQLKDVSIKVTIESAQSIKSIYSPTHDIDITRHGENKATVGFEARQPDAESDFQVIYALQKTDAPIGVHLMTFNDPDDAADDKGGFFLLLASPGAFTKGEVIAKDVVFVVDTSGSMAGEKIEQAKRALNYCIHSLNEGDRFQVLRFSTETEALFDGLVDVTREHREQAVAFVEGFQARGGTALEPALLEALKPARDRGKEARPYAVVFLTDGRPTVGTREEDAIIRNVTRQIDDNKNVRIFSFGVGLDVNTHLLDKITEQTRSFTAYVLPKEDIEVKVSNFFTRINEPALANVELSVDGDVRLTQVHPRPLPDLFVGDQLVVLGRYQGHGKATLALGGMVNGKPVSFQHEATFPRRAEDHHFIPRLWATRQVGYLLDQMRLHSSTDKELRDEITRLARRYGIVTPYTSYLILEDEDRRNVPLARRSTPAAPPAERQELGESFARMQNDRGGAGGVAGATANQSLRQARNFKAVDESYSYAQLDTGNALRAQQNVRNVRGRTFYENKGQWVDAQIAEAPENRVVRIRFDSPEYYQLLEKHPELSNWLSVGRNMQLMLDDTIYEIVDHPNDSRS